MQSLSLLYGHELELGAPFAARGGSAELIGAELNLAIYCSKRNSPKACKLAESPPGGEQPKTFAFGGPIYVGNDTDALLNENSV